MKNASRCLLPLIHAAIAILSGSRAQAASPQLTNVYPPGVQRGHEHTITFAGARLKDAEEILFYDGGVKVKKLEAVDPQNVRVTVEVAKDCRLGEHMAAVRTKERRLRLPLVLRRRAAGS